MQQTETMPVRHGLRALINGDLQADLQQMYGSLQHEIESLRDERIALSAGNEDVIRSVIHRMIQETDGDDAEPLPEVQQLVAAGKVEHEHMPLLATAARARIPSWLHGEAGSGKSTAAEKIADRERLDFRSISLCPTTSKSDLLGYRDATGQYRSTAFRDIYENGGCLSLRRDR